MCTQKTCVPFYFISLKGLILRLDNFELVFFPLLIYTIYHSISLVAQMGKNLPAVQATWAQSLGQEGPLEKGMVTHSSILDWRIPWSEESGRLQSMGSQRVGHNWVTNTFTSRFVVAFLRRKWQDFLLFDGCIVLYYVCISHLVYLSIYQWTVAWEHA